MRIIQIGQFPLSPDIIRGGVESSIYGLASEQAKGHSVIVFDIPRFRGKDSIEKMGEMTVYRFLNKGRHQQDALTRIPDMLEIMMSLQPSVCHLHGTSPFNWKVFKALLDKRIPVVVTVHGLNIIEKKKSLKAHFSMKTLYQLITQSYAEKRILNSAKEVIVDTAYVKETIRGYKLSAVPHMTVIPQGIHEGFFDISCSSDSREVLCVGAIAKRKGHLYLIQSFERLCESMADIHLTICGSMAEADYLSKIKDYLSSSPYRDRISLFTNATKDVLLSLYHKAHVFALHSQEESQGIALVEAMATGLPVVSTKVGGIPDVVLDGTTGLLTNYGDTYSFSVALEHLMGFREDWVKMSRECRKSAQAYSWKKISEAVLVVYNSIL